MQRCGRSTVSWCILFVLLGTAAAPAQAFRPTPDVQAVPSLVAPSLDGGVEWLNSAGPIALPQLRGKLVILDFWTYCCINCLQTLPDLKRLEQEYPDQLLVIGVHAPKFVGERDSTNLREAILRYGVEHPVINDANGVVAQKYAVTGWPALRFIDPTGNVIAVHNGEATYEALHAFVKRAVAKYRRAGSLDETPLRFQLERFQAAATPLRFPGKLLADAKTQRLYIADSGHHRIVVASFAGKLLGIIGNGSVGRQDGPAAQASFSSPQGLALKGQTLYVADTENHLVRQVDLRRLQVTTLAGTGQQAPGVIVRSTSRPTGFPLASPWDLLLHDDELYIAMAGSHQIWRLKLSNQRLHTYAGNGAEDIVDGPVLPRNSFQAGSACLAQPSGLASDGTSLFVADSEGSSIRAMPLNGRGNVTTLLGTAALPPAARLFTFGDRDGPLSQALLQHPLAIAYRAGELWVADTYNNKIKRIDLNGDVIETLAGSIQPGLSDDPPQFNEPAGLSVAGDKLFVADTNNHRICEIDLANQGRVRTLEFPGLTPPASPPAVPVAELSGPRVSFGNWSGQATDSHLTLQLQITLPEGLELNPQVPVNYLVRVQEGNSLIDARIVGKRQEATGTAIPITFDLPLSQRTGSTDLTLSVAFFYCDVHSKAICRMGNVTWAGEIRLSDSGKSEPLILEYQPTLRELQSRR